jgi:plasmid stabilization system protein ParE
MTWTVLWSVQARDQYLATLARVAKQDPLSAELVNKRVERTLQLLRSFPELGTPAPAVGVRTYPVPKTGHSFDYRLVRGQIRIQRWYRQRQKPVETFKVEKPE